MHCDNIKTAVSQLLSLGLSVSLPMYVSAKIYRAPLTFRIRAEKVKLPQRCSTNSSCLFLVQRSRGMHGLLDRPLLIRHNCSFLKSLRRRRPYAARVMPPDNYICFTAWYPDTAFRLTRAPVPIGHPSL